MACLERACSNPYTHDLHGLRSFVHPPYSRRRIPTGPRTPRPGWEEAHLAASTQVDLRTRSEAFAQSIAMAPSLPRRSVHSNLGCTWRSALQHQEFSTFCSSQQLSVSFSAKASGRKFLRVRCGNCCPRSNVLCPQSNGAVVATVSSVAVRSGTATCHQMPIQLRKCC